MGDVCMIPSGLTCCLGQRMVLLRPNGREVDGRYLLFALQSPSVQHEIRVNEGTGSTVSNLRIPLLKGLKVPVPPLPEQRRIAHILGTLDDKIELNRRMNETLEAMARALFKSWFVDFDPVRAKAEGRDPGLPADMAALFPASFVDSELGEIPSGWGVKRLPDVLDVNPSRALPGGTPAPYLEMANMPTSGARALQWETREAGSGMRFVNGDTLVARITPCLENGKTAFVDFLEDGQVGWGSTEYIVLRSKPPLSLEYAYYFARTEGFRAYAIANMNGTSGRQRVAASSFDNYPVVVPDKEVAAAFGKIANGFLPKMMSNDEQSRTLAALRDTLLPRLLSGELRVPAAEETVGC